MLVLTRKHQQRIKIGKDIWVTVLKWNREGVKLGIDAPKDVRILREELDDDGRDFRPRNHTYFPSPGGSLQTPPQTGDTA